MRDTSDMKMKNSILDQYEILTPLVPDGDVYLVMDRESREILVEKITNICDPGLYRMIEEKGLHGVPAMVAMEEIGGKWVLIEQYIHGHNLHQWVQREGVFSEEKTAYVSYISL